MDDKAVEEATRLGLLERLEARPASVEELASSLGISGRVIGGLVDRLVSQGVAEELPGSTGGPSQSPTYRLTQQQQRQQQRRSRVGGGGSQLKGPRSAALHNPATTHQGMQQHAYMAGMVPLGFGPFPGQQLLYYPAGLGAYQQPPMGPGGPWHRPAMVGGQRQPALQSAGSGGVQGMQVGAVGLGPQGMAGYPMQPYYFAAAGPMASPPLTPTLSGGMPRPPMPRAGSSSSASAGSTGWAGVPLSQSAADVAAAAGAAPSPRSQASPRSQQSQQELALAGSSQEVPAAKCPANSTADGERRSAASSSVQQQAVQPGNEALSSEEGSGSEEGGEGPPAAASGDSSSAGEGGSRRRGAASSAGSSGGSRRGRVSRERQPCAFFLKTGTCAYGDSCKFAHPFDRAPRVEFNSLGLPLRPGEPECSFFMKNYRCAFGHTCKFHHPELPPGVTASGTAVPTMYAVQYAVQYQPTASPVVSSVLGLKGGTGSSPGTPLGASPASPAGHAFYLAPHPFTGMPHGFSGRPGMTMPFPLMMSGGASLHRTSPQRGLSNGSSTSSRAAATAAAVQPAAHGPAAVRSSAGSEGDALPASVGESPRALQPIMVFSRRQDQDPVHGLSSRLDQLQLAGLGMQQRAQQGPATAGSAASDGVPRALPRSPRQSVDVVATA